MPIAYGAIVILGSANVNVSYVKLMIELIWCYADDNVKISANGIGNVKLRDRELAFDILGFGNPFSSAIAFFSL